MYPCAGSMFQVLCAPMRSHVRLAKRAFVSLCRMDVASLVRSHVRLARRPSPAARNKCQSATEGSWRRSIVTRGECGGHASPRSPLQGSLYACNLEQNCEQGARARGVGGKYWAAGECADQRLTMKRAADGAGGAGRSGAGMHVRRCDGGGKMCRGTGGCGLFVRGETRSCKELADVALRACVGRRDQRERLRRS